MSYARKSKMRADVNRAKASASPKFGRDASRRDAVPYPLPDRRPKVSVPSAGAGALLDGGAPDLSDPHPITWSPS